MNQNTKTILIILVSLLVFMSILTLLDKKAGGVSSEKYDNFAMCLADKGAKFYGAFWCSHCQAQKKMFENSEKIPYIECSTPDGNSLTSVCQEVGIESFPTWIFANGEKLTGEIALETLAKKTGCELPTITK